MASSGVPLLTASRAPRTGKVAAEVLLPALGPGALPAPGDQGISVQLAAMHVPVLKPLSSKRARDRGLGEDFNDAHAR